MKVAIIVPTYKRPDLLERLLLSICDAYWPKSFIGIWVVENGERAGSEEVVKQIAQNTDIRLNYIYEELAGPSFARNKGMQCSNADFFIFFDDDIRIDKNSLLAYESAFIKYGTDFFYGGPLQIDYDVKPPSWLLGFLPWSVQGVNLGDSEKQVTKPLFLGANLAVPQNLLFDRGVFDSDCPVGQSGLLGEETRLQQRLLDSGSLGIYVPEAVVWHYVPAERCTEKWALERQFRHGLTSAAVFKRENLQARYFLKVPLWLWRDIFVFLNSCIFFAFSSREIKFSKKCDWWFKLGSLKYFISN